MSGPAPLPPVERLRRAAKLAIYDVIARGDRGRYDQVRRRVAQGLAATGAYERANLRWLRRLVPVGGVAIDVGASYGVYVRALARRVGPAGEVHAFEPLAGCVAELRAHEEGRPGVHLVHAAVSARPGTTVIEVPLLFGRVPEPALASLAAGGEATPVERQVVDVVTLDGYCVGFERLDFIKIDAEGHELAVLLGAGSTIERLRPVIQCEITDADRRGAIAAWAEGAGYGLATLDRGSMCAAGDLPAHRLDRTVNFYLLPVR